MPTRAAPSLENAEEAVQEANRRFYLAFAALDMDLMDQVWLQDDWVQCVHPGWDLLVGWEEVRESWQRIFSGTQRMKVEISAMWLRVEGDVAWVACTEHVTSTFERGFDQAVVQTTNIFVRRPASTESAAGSHPRWLMVAHHASPLPSTQPPTVQ